MLARKSMLQYIACSAKQNDGQAIELDVFEVYELMMSTTTQLSHQNKADLF